MRRSHRRISPVAVTAVLAFVLLTPRTFAQVPVEFVPGSVNLEIGEHALVAVQVTGVPAGGLAAFQLDLDFDPLPIDLLNPNEAFRGTIAPFAPLGNNGSCLVVRGTPTCDDPDWFLIETGRMPVGVDTIDNVVGSLQIAYGTHGASAPPLGSGAIALIEVVGEYNGTSTVTVAGVILADNQEPPVEFASSVGSLTVIVGTGIANVPPVLAPIGDRTTFERIALSVPVAASDDDGDGLVLSTADLPAFCSLDDHGDGTGSIECMPLVGDAGVYPVTVGATDDGMPALLDDEIITITVDPTNCTDADLDGYGAPGDVSCPAGTQTDCDDVSPSVNPAATELCRNGGDDDCNGLADAQETSCAASVCLVVTLGAPAGDPAIVFDDALLCPAPAALARPIDLIWGDLAAVRLDAGDVKVGAATQVVCADDNDVQAFDNLRPDAGALDFFLVRESGQPTYGSSSAGQPRTPDTGDCP